MSDKCIELSLRDPRSYAFLRNFCKTYEILTGEDHNDALLRIFKTVCASLVVFRTQRELQIESTLDDTLDPGVDEFYRKIQLMVHPNVVPVTVQPSFSSQIASPVVLPRPIRFMNYIRVYCKIANSHYEFPICNCNNFTVRMTGEFSRFHTLDCQATLPARKEANDPFYLAGSSFVSGGTAEGTFESLENMRYNIGKPRVEDRTAFSRDLIIALADIFRTAGARGEAPPPPFVLESLKNHSFDGRKNAGYFNVYPSEMVNAIDDVVKLSNSATQNDCYNHTLTQVLNIADKVRAGLAKSPYDRSWFPTMLAKIAVKAEVRDPDVAEHKTRIFFIMCMIKLMIDKECFSSAMKNFYGKGFCGIGHVWANGGADKLAKAMNAWDTEWAWFCGDISKLDQRLLPGLLTMIFTLCLSFFSTENPELYAVLRAFICFSADDIAATLIKWTGLTYRIIVGVMFSGLFGTSWGDTIYVSVAIKMALMNFFRTHKIPRGYPVPVVRVYGDNIFIGWTKKYLPLFSNYIQKYFDDVWGLPFKAEETSYHDKFFTEIKTVYNSLGVPCTKVLYEGPFYLKRRFIEYKDATNKFAMPFRPSKDFFSKSLTTNKTDQTVLVWFSRWCGLLLDTMGTNPEAAYYLRYLMDRMLRDYKKKDERADLAQMFETTFALGSDFWDERVKKLGLLPQDYTANLSN